MLIGSLLVLVEIDYFLTQILTGMDGRARSPDYLFCNGVVGGVRLNWIRQVLYVDISELSPDNTVRVTLGSAYRRNQDAYYIQIFLITEKIELDWWRNCIAKVLELSIPFLLFLLLLMS